MVSCAAFMGGGTGAGPLSSAPPSFGRLATGSTVGEIRVFETLGASILETHVCHSAPVVSLCFSPSSAISSPFSADPSSGLLLSSTRHESKLWDASDLAAGALHTFPGARLARFDHVGQKIAAIGTASASSSLPSALSSSSTRRVVLYDVSTGQQMLTLSDTLPALSSAAASGRAASGILAGGGLSSLSPPFSLTTQDAVRVGDAPPPPFSRPNPSYSSASSSIGLTPPHFSPLDDLLLWNGALWDPRSPSIVHKFDQFSDYGGGGFHPAGNEVIINSEVWDLRTRRLLRSVPLLDHTSLQFNAPGTVLYATLRRSGDELLSALHGRRKRHPLFSAFATMHASDYSEIATVPVDRAVLDLALEPSDSVVAVVGLAEHGESESVARLYEVGRRRPMDDDSDPDDGEESDEEDDDGDSEDGEDGEEEDEEEEALDFLENLEREDVRGNGGDNLGDLFGGPEGMMSDDEGSDGEAEILNNREIQRRIRMLGNVDEEDEEDDADFDERFDGSGSDDGLFGSGDEGMGADDDDDEGEDEESWESLSDEDE